MHTSRGLIDLHERTHRSLQKLLDHLAGFSGETLNQEVEGFSYPTLRLQLHHLIGAERYWFGVLGGEILVDDDSAEHETIDDLRTLRADVAGVTAAYLQSASDDELSTPRPVTMWNGKQIDVMPAHVLLRTQTHIYQHHGEIASMSRLLGRSFPSGLDFPLV